MLLKSHAVAVVVLTGMGLFAVGCGDGKGSSVSQPVADHHDHDHAQDHGPKTLADAVTTLTGFRNVIRDAFAANDGDAAHGPLHEVGHVLEAFEELAAKQEVSPENAAIIKSSVESLFTSFGDVDKTMHGQEGKTYSEVSKDIDAALAALSAACGVIPATDATATSDAAASGEPAKDDTATGTPAVDPPVTDAPAADAAADKP